MICNSQGESSRSGFKALKRVWPELGKRLDAERGEEASDDDAPAWYGGKVFRVSVVVVVVVVIV